MEFILENRLLTEPLLGMNEYKDVLENIKKGISTTVAGPSESQRAHMAYAICVHMGQRGIYIAPDRVQAEKMYRDFVALFGKGVILFPPGEIILHDLDTKSYDAVYDRIGSLHKIVNDDYNFIVTCAEALCGKLTKKETFVNSFIKLTMGDRLEPHSLFKRLIEIGYERVEIVEGKAQFAVRGGIIDIFPIDSDMAVRIELFGDEIDSMRNFEPTTQRSVENVEKSVILPAREILYSPPDKEMFLQRIFAELKTQKKKAEECKNKDAIISMSNLEHAILADIERFQQQYYFAGMDKYIPYILGKPFSLIDYIEQDVLTFIGEPKKFKQQVEEFIKGHIHTCSELFERGQIPKGSIKIFFNYNDLRERLDKRKNILYLNTFPSGQSGEKAITSKILNSYKGRLESLAKDIIDWKTRGARIIIFSGTKSRGKMFKKAFADKGIEVLSAESSSNTIEKGQIFTTCGVLNKSFEYPDLGLIIISGKGLFGQDKKPIQTRVNRDKGQKISIFTELNIGDFVVHQFHGIGRYTGIEQLVVDETKRDYLKIRYRGDDFLYVPTSQLDLIQKYIGTEGKTPRIHRLGGGDWTKTRAKTKESLKEIAKELIRLYAQREAQKGYPFDKDTIWQGQFEELFPYTETTDQLKCIEEIKKDMESSRPMDRLLCGDVGYGKTEVAVRAIFKTVMEGKQVAYLVPTTILAQQHYNNFKDRMVDFPVSIEMVSRFRSQTEQKKILRDVKTGVIDVLIGTHRMLQKDVAFKDLGLLVIDEEQRFGVRHKERIKGMRANVDVLTLTATPIPRTLHMSLTGIRDISTIEEPPGERYPVQTYVMEFDPIVIAEAMRKEINRGGQVFYLYNRVRTINTKAAEIRDMNPHARIAIAHGQMNEKELEDIMFRFMGREYDILLCTTIIESGLDMPNVNTIVVEDADRLGLAQLYQLRGRVGRSSRLAHAYITYKKDKVLSEMAEKRLKAIKEFTQFGSGFKIAMRDLQIRGAGNILGSQQHGHIDSVGYDMYCRILEETVNELRGIPVSKEDIEISVDVNINAYIDEKYINDVDQKIEIYKKIASINGEKALLDVREELIDRYGDVPDYVENLLKIAYIKHLARECGFLSVQEKGDVIVFQYPKEQNINFELLGGLMDKYRGRFLFTATSKPYISYKISDIKRDEILDNIKTLLQDIKKLQ